MLRALPDTGDYSVIAFTQLSMMFPRASTLILLHNTKEPGKPWCMPLGCIEGILGIGWPANNLSQFGLTGMWVANTKAKPEFLLGHNPDIWEAHVIQPASPEYMQVQDRANKQQWSGVNAKLVVEAVGACEALLTVVARFVFFCAWLGPIGSIGSTQRLGG